MSQMQKVLWTKGVLLTPQHLQSQDRFLEELVRFHVASMTFSPWGFGALEIDREALAGGEVAVSQAAGIFPDGLPFDVPGSEPSPPPRPIEEHWIPDADALHVWLAVPELRFGGYNVSTNAIDRHTRYVAEVVTRRDENTGLAEKPIQVARKNLRLLFERETVEGHITLPLARIVRGAAGAFQLDTSYVPPLIDIGASEHLMAIARRIVEVLSAKSTSLSGARRQRSKGLADFGVADVANFWLLYTVNTWLPEFRHLYETRHGHPEQLYAAMVGLAGALTTFSTTIHPRDLPAYDHTDLTQRFGQLDETLRELLETVVPSNHVSLPLQLTDKGFHATAIDQDRYLQAARMYLAVTADTKADDIAKKAPQLMKISSADRLDGLIKRALSGLPIQHIRNPPSALPVRLDYEYFELDLRGEEWDAIKVARNMAVYVPTDLPGARLELIILLPEAR
jgi:type VI secretion system protein ImpJ